MFASADDSTGLLLWQVTNRWQAAQRAALKPHGLTHVQFVLLASLTWLAGAHRDPPESTDPGWRGRWAADAADHGQGPPPEMFRDRPNAGQPDSDLQRLAETRSKETIDRVRATVLPRLLGVAQ